MKAYQLLYILSLYWVACSPTTDNTAVDKTQLPAAHQEVDTTEKTIGADTVNGWALVGEGDTIAVIKPNYQPQEVGDIHWKNISKGMDMAIVNAPLRCNIGDSKIRIVRVDAHQNALSLVNAYAQQNGRALTAEEYATKHGLKVVINSSMFSSAGRSVGYMKNHSYINNGSFGKDKTIIAFNPTSDKYPPFKIIDTTCEDWAIWKNAYHTYAQNIRMIGCDRQIKWSKQEKFWSIACLGEDSQGRALFIHSRSPYRVNDICKMLLALPIDLQRCCYLEGGPEASLYVQSSTDTIRAFGSFETDFNEDDSNEHYWQIPNIIGVE